MSSYKDKKIKIALVGDSLGGGGAEKVHALLSIYFQKHGFEVHNCIFVDNVFYEYDGNLVNLGKIKPTSSSLFRKKARFSKFYSFIKQNNFDAVIDFRMRPTFLQEFIFSRFVYPKNAIYSVRSAILKFYFPQNKWLSSLIYSNKSIVTVSKLVEKVVVENNKNFSVKTIYNPIDFRTIEKFENASIIESNFILFVGSMYESNIKQIDQLIIAYSKSVLPSKNMKLILLGDGENRVQYQQLAEELGIAHLVIFKGVVQTPFSYYKNAIFTILSSKNEGFPNVLIESLACETPVVSFDCFSGPSEIIINHQNGILVENQNFEKLTEAMNLMVTDTVLYLNCKQNAAKSVEHFSVEEIGQQWIDYLKIKQKKTI